MAIDKTRFHGDEAKARTMQHLARAQKKVLHDFGMKPIGSPIGRMAKDYPEGARIDTRLAYGYNQTDIFVPKPKVAPKPVWRLKRPVQASSGTYAAGKTTTIVGPTPGSIVHYTTDGSDPTVGSAIYRGEEIGIGPTTSFTLKSLSHKEGSISDIVTSVYSGINPFNAEAYYMVYADADLNNYVDPDVFVEGYTWEQSPNPDLVEWTYENNVLTLILHGEQNRWVGGIVYLFGWADALSSDFLYSATMYNDVPRHSSPALFSIGQVDQWLVFGVTPDVFGYMVYAENTEDGGNSVDAMNLTWEAGSGTQILGSASSMAVKKEGAEVVGYRNGIARFGPLANTKTSVPIGALVSAVVPPGEPGDYQAKLNVSVMNVL